MEIVPGIPQNLLGLDYSCMVSHYQSSNKERKCQIITAVGETKITLVLEKVILLNSPKYKATEAS